MIKQDSLKGERVWEQVAVKDMPHPPYNYSASFVLSKLIEMWEPGGLELGNCFLLPKPRKKIEGIIARGGGEQDEYTDSLEETRFWVCVTRRKTEASEVKWLTLAFRMFSLVFSYK